jgi:hypothetical protein
MNSWRRKPRWRRRDTAIATLAVLIVVDGLGLLVWWDLSRGCSGYSRTMIYISRGGGVSLHSVCGD